MKICMRWLVWSLILIVVVLSGRLAWALSRSTIVAWHHWDLWLNVASLMVGIEQRPLGDKPPEEQAQFWLAEVDRVEGANNDPQLALGAAWLLDGPQPGFIRQHFRVNEKLSKFRGLIPAKFHLKLDYEAISSEGEKFERLCREDCLSKIETATRLDSDNVEMWRARAMLLFTCPQMSSFDFKPRRDDWLSVLDECAEHDPENALYDHLAAMQFWSMSAEYTSVDDGYSISKNDPATFDLGTARLKVALAKPHLKFGTGGYATTMVFLDQSSIAPTTHVVVAATREIDGRASRHLFRILRWHNAIFDVAERDQDFVAALKAARTVISISDQMSKSGNHPDGIYFRQFLRQSSLAKIKELSDHHQDVIKDDEVRRITAELEQVRLEREIQQEASKRLQNSGRETKRAGQPLFVLFIMAGQTLVIAATGSAIGFGLLFLLVSSRGNDVPPSFGWLRQSISWVVGIGGSFVLLGMCPAEIVTPVVQTWVVRGFVWLGFALVVVIPPFLCHRWIGLPWSQFAVLASGTTLPLAVMLHLNETTDLAIHIAARMHLAVMIFVLLTLVWLLRVSVRVLETFVRSDVHSGRWKLAVCGIVLLFALITVPTASAVGQFMSEHVEVKTWIPPAVGEEAKALQFTPSEFKNEMRPRASNWFWAFLQWQIHRGALVAAFTAVGVLIAWHALSQSKESAGGFREILRCHKRRHASQACKIIARSSLFASLLFLVPYLATTPSFVDSAAAKHRKERERVVNASFAWNELDSAITQIKADKTVMTRLKNEIAERNRQIAEQNRRREK